MIISRATEYAVIGLVHLARKKQSPLKVEEIAKEEGISAAYLEKVFQKLSEKALVKSKFGPGGGFVLAKDPRKISVFAVLKIFQARQMNQCVNFKQRDCGKVFCPFRQVVKKGEKLVFDFFKKQSIAKIAEKPSIFSKRKNRTN